MRVDVLIIPRGKWYVLPVAVRLLIVTAMDALPIPRERWYVRRPGVAPKLISTGKWLLVVVDVRKTHMVRLFAEIHLGVEPL
jgi:hypothetical protein